MQKFLRWLAELSLVAMLVGILGWALQPKHWLGFQEGGKIINSFRTLNGCRKEVQSMGGYCGKDCHVYPNGQIAECVPLVQIAKEQPN